jgi:hypothetical protein
MMMNNYNLLQIVKVVFITNLKCPYSPLLGSTKIPISIVSSDGRKLRKKILIYLRHT